MTHRSRVKFQSNENVRGKRRERRKLQDINRSADLDSYILHDLVSRFHFVVGAAESDHVSGESERMKNVERRNVDDRHGRRWFRRAVEVRCLINVT